MMDLEKLKSSKSTAELLRFSIINIDKPSGPTSFSVSQFVKNALRLTKTSHLGTLDPLVSGVLPVALSRACRLNDYLMHRNKVYVGIMRLHSDVSEKDLRKAIEKFIGKISQMPPVRSRVKRALREREIKTFNILEIDGNDILFETEVQAGTYIRKLCDDIGKELNGAHMLELRRTKAAIFSEQESINLHDFEKIVSSYNQGDDVPLRSILIPGEIIMSLLPVVHIRKDVVKKCLTGSPIFPNFLEDKKEIISLKENDKIAISCGDNFTGCYNFLGSETIIAKPEFVLN